MAEITEVLCREYVDWRCAQTDKRATKGKGKTIKPTTARRELVTLSAALNWCFRNKKLDRPVAIMLPKVAERRERYLTRAQVAALLWAALGFNRDGTRNRFRINRHLARFILIGLYTGTRHDAILRLQWMSSTSGGWFDLESGVLYRRPQDAIETNKRRTPSPIRRASCRTSYVGAGFRLSTSSSTTASRSLRSCAALGRALAKWPRLARR